MHLAKTLRAIDHTIFYRTFLQLCYRVFLLLFQISDYIKVFYLIPIDMAHGQAKSNNKKCQRQPSEPKVQGELFAFHILAV